MPIDSTRSLNHVLEPAERISEVLFGLIMVLTFTGSLSVAEADRAEVRTMLIAALGCNIVWGVIDSALYLMGCLADKGRNLMIFRAVRRAADTEQAQRLIAAALPAVVSAVLQREELEAIHQRLRQLPEPPVRAHLDKGDWLGAFGIFFIVFLSTFPVAIPFIFINSAGPALRFSNGIAILMLFFAGYAYGKCVERRPWLMGISMVILGSVLVGLTIALGG